MSVFEEGGKTGVPEKKNPWSKDENQQQPQPTCDAWSGSQTRGTLVGGECSHQCAISAPSKPLPSQGWMTFGGRLPWDKIASGSLWRYKKRWQRGREEVSHRLGSRHSLPPVTCAEQAAVSPFIHEVILFSRDQAPSIVLFITTQDASS